MQFKGQWFVNVNGRKRILNNRACRPKIVVAQIVIIDIKS